MPELPSNNSSDLGSKAPVTAKTADDINDLFKELDNEPEKEPAPKVTKSGDDDKEVKEVKEDDLELVDPDEDAEKLDLKTDIDENLEIGAPPRKKEILKEFPELFKKFPFLEKMLYRDKEYNELFGSFDDAKEIAERAETFKSFEDQLLSGNTEEILKNVKETDEKAFDIIVDDYLPTLMKIDKDAYFHVVGNLNKRLIAEMVKEANATGRDDLKEAALLVNQFVFGTSTYTPPQNRVDRSVDEKSSKIEQERLDFVRERFESSRDDLQSRVDNTLKATITEYIDPKGQMSPFTKKHAINEAIRYLNEHIGSDSMTSKNLDKLWKAAFDSKFNRESLSKIQSFYLGKARSGLKNAILKARAEALKDATPRVSREKEDEEADEAPTRQRRIETGRTSQPKGKNEMKKGETVTDYFMRD